MNVRQLQSEDIKTFKNTLDLLLRTCTDISFQEKVSDDFYASKLDDMEEYLALGKAHIFGAFENNYLVGFLWAYELKTLEGRKFHVAYFAVLPEFSGRGIGSLLMSAAEHAAEELGINKMELIVSKSNEKAVSFYKNHEYSTERYILTKIIR